MSSPRQAKILAALSGGGGGGAGLVDVSAITKVGKEKQY